MSGNPFRVVVFSAKRYDRQSLPAAAKKHEGEEFVFIEAALSLETVALAKGAQAICIFVNDAASAPVVEALAAGGTKLILLRCAGFDRVDVKRAKVRALLCCEFAMAPTLNTAHSRPGHA